MPKQQNNLPEKFLERCEEIFGHHYFDKIKYTFIRRPVTFRVNTIKAKREEILEILQREGFKVKRVSWFGDAFILENKSQGELADLNMYKEGKIYLQSLASMAPPLVLGALPGEKVLDLTAAPGSKTSQIAAMMQKTGELFANEIDEIRFQKLEHNMRLLGCTPVIPSEVEGSLQRVGMTNGEKWQFKLSNQDGSKFCAEYPAYFDKILLDAPCGAEARIIADERRTFSFWDERKIKDICYRQRKLLFSAWSALKPGGILVYSTCTFAPEENEEQIQRLMEKFPGEVKVEKIDFKGIETAPVVTEWRGKKFDATIKNVLRILPSKEMEGFFVTRLKKIN